MGTLELEKFDGLTGLLFTPNTYNPGTLQALGYVHAFIIHFRISSIFLALEKFKVVTFYIILDTLTRGFTSRGLNNF